MEYVMAFLIGGILCVIGQLLQDIWNFSPVHIMSMFIVGGAILGIFGIYDWLQSIGGAGMFVPISGLGNLFVKGVLNNIKEHGFVGIAIGVFAYAGMLLSLTIFSSFLIAIIFKPKG